MHRNNKKTLKQFHIRGTKPSHSRGGVRGGLVKDHTLTFLFGTLPLASFIWEGKLVYMTDLHNHPAFMLCYVYLTSSTSQSRIKLLFVLEWEDPEMFWWILESLEGRKHTKNTQNITKNIKKPLKNVWKCTFLTKMVIRRVLFSSVWFKWDGVPYNPSFIIMCVC